MLAQRAQSETEEGETRQSRSSPRARSRFAGDRGAPPHSSPIPSRHQARRNITTMSSMKPLSLLARIELLTGVRLRRWIARWALFENTLPGRAKIQPSYAAADGMGRQLRSEPGVASGYTISVHGRPLRLVSISVQSNLPLYVITILTVCLN